MFFRVALNFNNVTITKPELPFCLQITNRESSLIFEPESECNDPPVKTTSFSFVRFVVESSLISRASVSRIGSVERLTHVDLIDVCDTKYANTNTNMNKKKVPVGTDFHEAAIN